MGDVGSKVFSIPLQTVAVDDTSASAFLDYLGLLSNVKMLVKELATSACLLKVSESGQVEDLEPSWGGNATLRAAQVASVDALLGSEATAFTNGVAVSAAYEATPLARAEWIKFVALFFNQEAAANLIFDGIRDRYLCHRQAAVEAVAGATQLKVAWTSASSSQWVLSRAAYKLKLTQDSGAEAVGSGTTSTTFGTAAALLQQLQDVDILIDDSYVTSEYTWQTFLTSYGLAADSSLRFVRNQRVWRVDGVMNAGLSLDWFAGAIVEADALLGDMIGVVQGQSGTRWLRRLSDSSVVFVSAATCSDPLVAAVTKDVCVEPLNTTSVVVEAGTLQLPGNATVLDVTLGSTSGNGSQTIIIQGTSPHSALTHLVVAHSLNVKHVAALNLTGVLLFINGTANFTMLAQMLLSSSSILSIASNALASFSGSVVFSGNGGVTNRGTMLFTGMGSLFLLEVPLDNTAGTLLVTAGTLLFASQQVMAGTISIRAGATLRVEADSSVAQSAVLSGTGQLLIVSSILTVNGGTIATAVTLAGSTQKIATQAAAPTLQGSGQVAGDLTLQNGQLVIDMSKQMTVGGNLVATSSTLSFSNVDVQGFPLQVAGKATLSNCRLVASLTSTTTTSRIVLVTYTSTGFSASDVSISVDSRCLNPSLVVTSSALLLTCGQGSGSFPWWASVTLALCLTAAMALIAALAYWFCRRRRSAKATLTTVKDGADPWEPSSSSSWMSDGKGSSHDSYLVWDETKDDGKDALFASPASPDDGIVRSSSVPDPEIFLGTSPLPEPLRCTPVNLDLDLDLDQDPGSARSSMPDPESIP
eukprot:GGOE01023934.1.p1 GENE.GGOE01023934.1~~GGOE01023934.1.p1  ORF type:complete len:896 (+),score=242.03 GGOE01023934.1:247-2688(+)